jgi:hypothetical protein
MAINEKCNAIEAALLETAEQYHAKVDNNLGDAFDFFAKAKLLMRNRRSALCAGDKPRVCELSKMIQEELRGAIKLKKRGQVDKILTEFKGLRFIAGVRNNGRRQQLSSILDDTGKLHTSEQDILNVFATFYEHLYMSKCVGGGSEHEHDCNLTEVEDITTDEIEKQIKQLRNDKAADQKGIIAEMMKQSGERFMEVVADLFNDIIQLRGGVPETWRKTRLRVLFKKGNVQCPDNYTPISILPILLKLFSRVIYARISNTLNAGQSVDQAGFRANYGCDDHLFTITMLKEKCEEFGISLWVATVDYRKASDTVEHAAIWTALAKQGVAERYIKVLRRFYEEQTGGKW